MYTGSRPRAPEAAPYKGSDCARPPAKRAPLEGRGHGSGSGCRRGTAPAEPAHLWSRRRALPPLRPVRAARWRRQASGGLGRTALLPLPLLLGRRPEHLCLLRHLWRRCSLLARATSALAASLAAALACCCHDWPAGFALAAAGLATALAAAAPSATACALPASAFASFSNLAFTALALVLALRVKPLSSATSMISPFLVFSKGNFSSIDRTRSGAISGKYSLPSFSAIG